MGGGDFDDMKAGCVGDGGGADGITGGLGAGADG